MGMWVCVTPERKAVRVLHTSVFIGHQFAQAEMCILWDGEQCAELLGSCLLQSCLGSGGNLFSISGSRGESPFSVMKRGRRISREPAMCKARAACVWGCAFLIPVGCIFF